jgi:hypothetical protein
MLGHWLTIVHLAEHVGKVCQRLDPLRILAVTKLLCNNEASVGTNSSHFGIERGIR